MPDFGTPSHIDLSVSDAESSARWYCEVLGLRRVRRADFENRIMIVLVHRTTGLVVGLNQHTTVPVARFDDRNVGLDLLNDSATCHDGDSRNYHFPNAPALRALVLRGNFTPGHKCPEIGLACAPQRS